MGHEANLAKSASFLGKALVEEGVLGQEELDRAVRVQQYLEQPKQLGQVLIELGYASKQAIIDTINRHGSTMRLGEILLEQDLISMDVLEHALRIQQERGIKLGEALIELGALTERGLLQNLAHQGGVPYIEPLFGMIERSVLSGMSPDYLVRHGLIPFSKSEDGYVTVVVSDLQDEQCRQILNEIYGGQFKLALGPSDVIQQAIEDFRHFRLQEPEERKARITKGGEDTIVSLLDHIIGSAIDERASDVHIEPMSDVVRVRYRIDGVLVYKTDLPKDLLPRLVSRVKVLAESDISEHQRHQGGHVPFHYDGREFDLRLSIYVSVHGECVVLRILNKQAGLVGLEELGMNPTMLDRYRTEVLDAPTGVVLITGPTGSGKTTTLYSSLVSCLSTETKIITVEDPVEYMIDGIIQCSIHTKVGRTFESSLREIVRQDPDLIVLGEIRDRVSAETAIQAALTGHKVYSTFHTEDTIGGLLRLIDMDIETFLISSTVISVVAQRLLRRVCADCAAPYVPSPAELDQLGLSVREVREFEFKRGLGCKRCNHTGYYGRIGVFELLIVNDAVKEVILQKRPSHEIRQACMDSTGLISIREDGIVKAIRGLTTLSEVLRNAPRTATMRPVRQILVMTQ